MSKSNYEKLYPIEEGIKQRKNEINKLKLEYNEHVEFVQLYCDHKIVIECEWLDQLMFNPLKPKRMCLRCRYEEEGRYITGYYDVLHNPEVVLPIERNEFYKFRIGV